MALTSAAEKSCPSLRGKGFICDGFDLASIPEPGWESVESGPFVALPKPGHKRTGFEFWVRRQGKSRGISQRSMKYRWVLKQ